MFVHEVVIYNKQLTQLESILRDVLGVVVNSSLSRNNGVVNWLR